MDNYDKPIRLSFSRQEQRCEATFSNGGPYWHLCTPGQFTEILCETREDYVFYMNLIAIATAVTGVKIITFQVMSNHFHFILEGPECLCQEFFKRIKNRMLRYYPAENRYKNLVDFTAKVLPIPDLVALRNEVVYTNRNGYLIDPRYTPFSYPWGSGNLFFNPYARLLDSQPYSSLSDREKKSLCKSRLLVLPEGYRVRNGVIVPESYCSYSKGEALFRDAHHYFASVSKNYEAYSAVAKSLGEEIILTDEEMFAMVVTKSKREYGENRPSMLPQNVKLDYARMMRQDYYASEGQIQRILKLDRKDIGELFGRSATLVVKTGLQ